MVVEGIHVEDIFELVSLVPFLIISWTFRILAHEEDQDTDFLSIPLKQTKAGPQSWGTPFLVLNLMKCRENVYLKKKIYSCEEANSSNCLLKIKREFPNAKVRL